MATTITLKKRSKKASPDPRSGWLRLLTSQGCEGRPVLQAAWGTGLFDWAEERVLHGAADVGRR